MFKLVTAGVMALACSIGILAPANAAQAPSEVQLVAITSEGVAGDSF